MAVTLRPHQTEAVSKMHNGCILAGEPGSGKSLAATFYFYTKVCGGRPRMPGIDYKPMSRPMPLYIITTAKKRTELEWEQEVANFGLGREADENGVQVFVDSWQNITQYDHIEGAFFIFDENRLVGDGAWVSAFLKIAKSNQWVILSGTPGDVWKDYLPVFLAHGFYRNKTEFYDRHVEWDRYAKFPKIKKYHNTAVLEQRRRQLLVPMPFERHTSRHVAIVPVDFNSELLSKAVKDRWHVYEDRPLKNAAELYSVSRKIVNTDPSRLGELLKVLEKHPRLIVFYNYNYELEMLRGLKNLFDFPIHEWNGQKHEPVPDTEKWIYLVQYTGGAEAWNCITTNAIFYWSLNPSWRILEQTKGRIDRLNTPFHDLYYYICRSLSVVDKRIWHSVQTKEEFNKRAFSQELWSSYVPF